MEFDSVEDCLAALVLAVGVVRDDDDLAVSQRLKAVLDRIKFHVHFLSALNVHVRWTDIIAKSGMVGWTSGHGNSHGTRHCQQVHSLGDSETQVGVHVAFLHRICLGANYTMFVMPD